MSSDQDLTEIYRLFGNPLEKQFADMRNSFARSKIQKPNSDTKLDIGSLGLQGRNHLKFVNEHYNIKLHDLGTSEYFPAFEPDYDKCKLIIMTDHYGYKMFDDSQIPSSNPSLNPAGQDITMEGDPRLESGFDRGYGDATNTKKRQALHFNRPTSPTLFKDYLKVRDQGLTDLNKSMRVNDASSGFSFMFRGKLSSFASNGVDNKEVTLLHNQNDFLADYGSYMTVESTGKVRFAVSNNNVDKFRQSTTTLSLDTDHEIWGVYDPAGATDDDKLKIYWDGALKTNEASTMPTKGGDSENMYIGKRNDLDGGYVQGYIIYVKYFQNYKVSLAEVQQHFTNKLTIANIAANKVATTENSVPRNV